MIFESKSDVINFAFAGDYNEIKKLLKAGFVKLDRKLCKTIHLNDI